MFILYFRGIVDENYYALFYQKWIAKYNEIVWRPNESFWLVPGTDPDDPFYVY